MNLRRPSPGVITSPFGQRTGGFHEGIDFGWGNGWNITAAAAGTVRHAGPGGAYGARYGNLTIIDHGGGIQTRYAHQSRIDVRAGQKVAAGQAIGVIGGSGAKGPNTYAPHLHFELVVGGRKVNPGTSFNAPASGNITPIIEVEETEDSDMKYIHADARVDAMVGEFGYYPAHDVEYAATERDIYGGGKVTTRAYDVARQAALNRRNGLLVEIVNAVIAQLPKSAAASSGVAIDYAALAKAVNDDAAARLAN